MQRCNESVRTLAAAGAWSDCPGSFRNWTATTLTPPLVGSLRASGVLATREDEFGETLIGLVAGHVVCDTEWRVQPVSTVSLLLPSPEATIANAHKLRLVLELRRQGWQGQHGMLTYLPQGDRIFPLSMVGSSTLYFRCLLQADGLFARGLRSILSARPHAYYRCLLELEDLSALIASTDDEILQMLNWQFLEILGSRPCPHVHLALEDGDVMGDRDGGDRRPWAIEDEPRDTEVVGVLAAGVDVLDDDFRTITIEGRSVRITLAHASGQPRAYITCDSKKHRSCFKYRQLNQDVSIAMTVGYCLAWAEMGSSLNRDEHQSRDLQVSCDRVEYWAAKAQTLDRCP